MNEVMLLADPKSNAWEFAEKIQDYISSEKNKVFPLAEVSIEKFRNGEIDMHVEENMRRKEVYFIQDSTKNPQQWWVELLILKDLLLSASADRIAFVLPNVLYSRKDRKEKPHVPISARALAQSLSGGLGRVITMDMHADQIQGFYPANVPVDHLHSFSEVVKYVQKNPLCDLEKLVVVSPDTGGVGRARSFSDRLDVKNPFAIIYKQRSKPGEIGEMKLNGEVNGLNALLIDDIIDSGGTLCEAAKLLKEKGANEVYCYGTHGIFSKGTKELCGTFSRVMTSNTHNLKSEGVEIIDMSPIFAEAIYRNHNGESISELYK